MKKPNVWDGILQITRLIINNLIDSNSLLLSQFNRWFFFVYNKTMPAKIRNRCKTDTKKRMVDKSNHDNGYIDCPYCETPIHYFDCEVDHINPSSTGGSNKRNNLWLVCKECNRLKRNMSITVWCYTMFITPESMYKKLKDNDKWIPDDLLALLNLNE